MLDVHLFVIPPVFTATVGFAVVWIAFCLGGRRERVIALAQVLTGLASRSICSLSDCWADTHRLGTLSSVVADAVFLAVCIACLRRADRYWIVWVSAFALLAVATDLAGLLIPGVTAWAYLSADVVWCYLSSAAVLWGVWGSNPTPNLQAAA